jgi:hypothetical protein
MKNRIRSFALVSMLLLVASGRSPESVPQDLAGAAGAETIGGWIVDRSDNICGLDDPRMLSRPARVDYDILLRATPEMRRLRDEKIDPNSSEGIQLRQAAVDRVRNAADRVRQSESHCSVWKQIRHQDGRSVPDITDLVRNQL